MKDQYVNASTVIFSQMGLSKHARRVFLRNTLSLASSIEHYQPDHAR